jgi:hypothetical protein
MIPVLTILVVQRSVPVEEGAATDIFAGNTDTVAGNQQRRVGQVLGHPPVDRELAFAHQATVLDDLLHPAVQREIRGMVVNRSARRCNSPSGTLVSQFSMYFGDRKGVQSMVIGCL